MVQHTSTEIMLLDTSGLEVSSISLAQNLPVAAREDQNMQPQLLKFLRKQSAASEKGSTMI